MKFNIRERIRGYMRVLKVAKKPGVDEFSNAVRICFMGFIVVGLLGFIIYIISVLLG